MTPTLQQKADLIQRIKEANEQMIHKFTAFAKNHNLPQDAKNELIDLWKDATVNQLHYDGIRMSFLEPETLMDDERYNWLIQSYPELLEEEDTDPEAEAEDWEDYVDRHSDMVNQAHERSEGMER